LTQYFPPESAPGGIRFYELAKYLVERGHNVTVVTGFPNYPRGIKHEKYRRKLFLRENVDGIKIVRTFLYASPNKSSFNRLLNYLSFTFTSLWGILFSTKPDIVYVITPPFFLGLPAYISKKLRSSPYIFEVQDLWPQAPIERGYVKNKSIAQFLLRMEKFIYQKAAKVFVISDRMKKEIVDKGIDPEKLKVNFNWIDTDLFVPKKHDGLELRRQYDLENKFIIMFAGNMGIVQGLDHVIESANILRDKKDIVFMLVGDGIEREKLVSMKEKYKLKNVIFVPYQPFEKIPSVLSMSDVLIIHLNKASFREAAVPSKLQAYMSCGKPVLVAANGAPSDIVTWARCGLTAEPENPESIAEAVSYLYSNRDILKDMGMNARNYAIKHFNKGTIARDIEQCLFNIVIPKNEA
jgi:glycosyltransferase involved in cell wall biosynthesis